MGYPILIGVFLNPKPISRLCLLLLSAGCGDEVLCACSSPAVCAMHDKQQEIVGEAWGRLCNLQLLVQSCRPEAFHALGRGRGMNNGGNAGIQIGSACCINMQSAV